MDSSYDRIFSKSNHAWTVCETICLVPHKGEWQENRNLRKAQNCYHTSTGPQNPFSSSYFFLYRSLTVFCLFVCFSSQAETIVTLSKKKKSHNNFSNNFRRFLDSLNTSLNSWEVKIPLIYRESIKPSRQGGKKEPKHIGVAHPATLKVSSLSSSQAPHIS